MKVIVVLSLVAAAFASLEPAGYRPPGSAPSTRYLPSNNYEAQSTFSEPSAMYLPASQTQYSAGPARVSAPSSAYLPANNYQAPAQTSAMASKYVATPAMSYGVPDSSRYSAAPAAPVNRYLPASNAFSKNAANSGYRYNAAEESEPAKYDFQYEVKDNEGNDFGHQETRDGDDTRGMYTVLLPDGRKQIVEYTADQDGYKPRISYEEPKQGYSGARGRLGLQAGGYSQGYPEGPY